MEKPFQPEVAILDPHIHLWKANPPYRDFLVPELVETMSSGHKVLGTIFIECDYAYRTTGPRELRSVGETEFAARAVRESVALGGPPILGIVGTAELRLGGRVTDVLAAHIAVADGMLKGIRDRLAVRDGDEINQGDYSRGERIVPGLLRDPDFQQGLEILGAHDLHFEAWIYHDQLPDLTALVRKVPQTSIVLNHIGAPANIFRPDNVDVSRIWRADMAQLAQCENVTVKIGGMGMDVFGGDWGSGPSDVSSDHIIAQCQEVVHFIIDTFGPDRCIFEGNFPVDQQQFDHTVLWNAYKRMASAYSEAEYISLVRGTAERVYRL